MAGQSVSAENSEFWDELCGSQLASQIGITDADPVSLKKFDEWYFSFYPYLLGHIRPDQLKRKHVLEIGLGYGSVSQKIAESGADYLGLDIAAGPVSMVNRRLRQAALPGQAIQRSILEPQLEPESFDAVVAIGCLHHTGDLKLAIRRCRELLRPGGRFTFMVYYAYSYRRYWMAPKTTLSYLAQELKGYRGVVGTSLPRERAVYDSNSRGECAPHTDWISIGSLKSLCGSFSGFDARLENAAQDAFFRFIPRQALLSTFLPRLMGLDLYVTAIK